jgi:CheY-like chemotaxis protein
VPPAPVWVAGDAARLAQVLTNLLDNAVKFRADGGRVAVRLTAPAGLGQAVLEVADDGSGITAEMLPRLFDAFAQADRSLDRKGGGLGLGLTLVKGLVELHGGAVQATSDGPGKGATFTVRLPLKEEVPALAPAAEPPSPAAEALNILVVEDHRDAAESLRMLLELLGHRVTVAHTGPEGVAAARALKPDVVLCDIGLPGMDGYGVAGTLRQDPTTARTNLIAITGYGQEADRRRAHQAGFNHHLTKPVDPEALQPLLVRSA